MNIAALLLALCWTAIGVCCAVYVVCYLLDELIP